MKHLFFCLSFFCSLFIFNMCATDHISDETEVIDLSNDFSERTYRVFVPSTYDKNKKISLVMAFHGAGGTAYSMENTTGFNDYASNNNFIVCYPQALVENWEEGCKCNKPYRLGIDDVGFVNYLLDKLTSQYNIDSNRIYAVGFSQGGLFVQNLACKLSNRFAAVATVASSMSVPLYNDCEPSEEISMLMIHGTQDKILPFEGSDAGNFSLLSSPDAISFWADDNGCDGSSKFEDLEDHGDPTISVRKRYFDSCLHGTEAILYEVIGGSHQWFYSKDIDASKVIIDFMLSKHK